VLFAVVFQGGFVARAQSKSDSSHANDIQAINSIVHGMENAWNKGDARAFAEHFSKDGGFTNVLGTVVYGRERFEQRHAEIFSGVFKGSVAKLVIQRLRFVRADVAIADLDSEVSGSSRLLPGIEAPADGVIRSRLQLVLLKDGNQWWMTAYHDVDVKQLPARN
jgi:uncharacterized protein (TIGR02246 family)